MIFDMDQALTRADALKNLREGWSAPSSIETVALDKAYGRVLAEDAIAACSFPLVRSSKRDGIAVKSVDFSEGAPDGSTWVRGINYAQADTGDDFPDAFDAVVAVENIERLENGGIRFLSQSMNVSAGDGVNQSGSIVKAGSLLVPAGTMLTPELVAACAIGGLAQVSVKRKIRVAFLPTGSELVPWGSYAKRGQNIESNSLLVRGLLEQWGAEAITYPLVEDKPETLKAALDRALAAADIVLVNGGSSCGEEDYNSQMLQARASYFRHGVLAMPGRPIGMAIIEGKPVINVPGPALACFLAMDWLVRGLVAHYYGIATPQRTKVKATLAKDIKKPVPFERLIRVSLSPDGQGGYSCAPLPDGMGVPAQLVNTDAMLTIPIGVAGAHAGDVVEVALLRPMEIIEGSWA